MLNLRPCALFLPIILGSTACLSLDAGSDDADHVGESALESRANNGMSLNGMSLNGMSLNGMSLNGMSLNGMSLNGMSLNGMSLNGMSLNGSQLGGVSSDGQPVTGAALVGAQMNGTLSNGDTLALRVDSATALTGANSDVWAYAVSYAQAGGSWAPLCGTVGDAPVSAIPLNGTWSYEAGVAGGGAWTDSPTAFTFGCRGTALAKCVELGYKPWQTVGGVSMREHHQACTRMIRADYCGNGTPGTINGWQINLWDDVGIQADTEGALQWVFEGEWTASGATCVDEYRALELVVSGDVPTCALEKITSDCGAPGFAPGVLLKDEYNSAGVLGLVQQLALQNPNTPLAEIVEDALFALENGFGALAASPPDRVIALAHFEDGAGDLTTAISGGLLASGYGNGLLSRIAGVSRFQALGAAADNACQAQYPTRLTDSHNLLAAGDVRRAGLQYTDAVALYGDAVAAAQAAHGTSCTP